MSGKNIRTGNGVNGFASKGLKTLGSGEHEWMMTGNRSSGPSKQPKGSCWEFLGTVEQETRDRIEPSARLSLLWWDLRSVNEDDDRARPPSGLCPR